MGADGDVENPGGVPGEEMPLRPKRHVLLRRSNQVFVEREPRSGILGSTATLCCSLLCSLMIIAFFNILSVASIVIGSVYIHKTDCPAQPNIAPTLIATGVLAILLSLLEGRGRVLEAMREGMGGSENAEKPKDCFHWLTNFLRISKVVLFIYFCVIVYSLYSTVQYEPVAQDVQGQEFYCNPTLYLFSFWVITLVFISIGSLLLFCCLFCCCLAICVHEVER
jgi:hypothetical protein